MDNSTVRERAAKQAALAAAGRGGRAVGGLSGWLAQEEEVSAQGASAQRWVSYAAVVHAWCCEGKGWVRTLGAHGVRNAATTGDTVC